MISLHPTRPLRFGEFVALMALMMSTVAFSIDAMLPALPDIGAALSPDAPGRAQLIVTSFVLGLGVGTLVFGPISDAFGRKSVLLAGLAIFVIGAALALQATSIEGLLGARVLQGVGAAAPRVVATAMVRDLHEGRRMARVMSIIMTLFVLVPALAPMIGAGIIWLANWQAIFLAFIGFGLVSGLWLTLRQPETLPPENRRSLAPRGLARALWQIITNRAVMIYVAALSFAFAPLYLWLSNLPMIFDDVFNRAAEFPFWFAATALFAGSASFLNARLVMQLGMRRIATVAFACQLGLALLYLLALQAGLPPAVEFALFFAFMTTAFLAIGLTFGNLNALAMQPLGHMAGIGASTVQAISTVAAVIIAVPISLAYDGTQFALVGGVILCSACALGLMLLSLRLPEG